MKIKTSTLTGEKLAYWTARAQEFPAYISEDSGRCYATIPPLRGFMCYEPHINAGQAMELMKKYSMGVTQCHPESWDEQTVPQYIAQVGFISEPKHAHSYGHSYEEAICRAVVDFVFGEFVEDK